MSWWDRLKGELIDIIEWLDSSQDAMVYRFERYGNEIKNGARLVVREGQVAAFVNEGRLADVFEPGTHTLETRNLPVLSTLQGWPHGFASPFKAEVYFVSTRRFTDLKWGTKNPVMLRDAEFGPVRLRAFGTYTIRVSDAGRLLTDLVGTNPHFSVEQISDQLRNLLVSSFTDVLGESRIPVLDLAANYDELSAFLSARVQPDFDKYGLEVLDLRVENISLPPEVEQALDKRTSMGIVGNLAAYTQYQAATAMQDAARNPGGTAAAGVGMGVGFAMANQMAQSAGAQAGQTPPPLQQTPPPLPQGVSYFVAVGSQQTGPFDEAALRQKVAGGELTAATLVWKVGLPQWLPAGQVPELANILKSAASAK